uniref:Uncharacterized protein n=1 Tax=Myotis myotis TaxID=51298 RepID=A0A7J7V3H5_MYOMY|nr:hypothetical protein mMyoMyo1_008454 [Myotis myotis]
MSRQRWGRGRRSVGLLGGRYSSARAGFEPAQMRKGEGRRGDRLGNRTTQGCGDEHRGARDACVAWHRLTCRPRLGHCPAMPRSLPPAPGVGWPARKAEFPLHRGTTKVMCWANFDFSSFYFSSFSCTLSSRRHFIVLKCLAIVW